jgi:hypothetical protein
MNGENEWSLRSQVEKWLWTSSGQRNRIIRFTRTRGARGRYIQIEIAHGSHLCTLFLFRHGDGSWCVFPPSDEHPRMAPERLAA